jgi:ATP-binding cassette subfamily F protein 3
VRLDDVTLGYGDPATAPPVLAGVSWSILAGARIGLLGPNGAGKSTLLKAVAGVLAPRSGERLCAQALKIGYFAQHQVEQLRAAESPLWHLAQIEPAAREQELRDFLGGFDFHGDAVSGPVARFSGGEKARLTLALLVRQRPNLLILDEPTNHLDIEMREALAEALQDYDGALLVVAHDRHLLRATADELWLVADAALAPFDGDLDDYRDWVLGQKRRALESIADAAQAPLGPAPDRKAQRRAEAQMRQQAYAKRKPLATRLAAIEREMDALGAEQSALETWFATPEAYAGTATDELKSKLARQGDLVWQLARLEAEWLELAAALDRLAP